MISFYKSKDPVNEYYQQPMSVRYSTNTSSSRVYYLKYFLEIQGSIYVIGNVEIFHLFCDCITRFFETSFLNIVFRALNICYIQLFQYSFFEYYFHIY